MKKILALSVALMYLAITSGLVLQVHYCMGRQTGSSVQLAELSTHTCSVCGMQNAKNKCCHDEVAFIKLQVDHQPVTADYTISALGSLPTVFDFINPAACLPDAVCTEATASPSPPGDEEDGQPSLFIFHRLLRI